MNWLLEKIISARLSIRFCIAAILIAIADAITKQVARNALVEPAIIIPRILQLKISTNTGMTFSLLQGYNAVLAVVTTVMIIVLFYVQALAEFRSKWHQIGFGLVAGGAFGNLIDRVLHGAVTDFIAFSFYPAFNIADGAIVFGALLIIYAEIRKERSKIMQI